jgi:precorrin-4/cobalt-precorrin-4 C11-methyltransferase
MMYYKRKILSVWFVVAVMVLFLFVPVRILAQRPEATKEKGKFYLVGMGPGDPDLATIRAMKIVEEADLIICHKRLKERFAGVLQNKEVVGTPVGVWIWFGYGKKASDFQGEELKKFQGSEKARGQLIAKVRKAITEGKRVAVLASGDPLIYGPWSWCLEEFQDLDPVVAPGLSCFNAAHAVLKKDVTWSDTVKSTILTANDWFGTRDKIEKLASNRVTMVIFTMGLELKDLIEKLSTHYSPHTPIAIVCYAGYKDKEYVVRGTLGAILDKIGDEKLPFEHLVYVGENVNFKWKNE